MVSSMSLTNTFSGRRGLIIFFIFLLSCLCVIADDPEEVIAQVAPDEAVICTRLEDEELKCNGIVYMMKDRAEDEKTFTYDEPQFWICFGIACFLVTFGGLMSGLTVGLMALDQRTLGIIKRAGTDEEKRYAAKILPIVEQHHLLLVSLLLSNAIAMEALPIFIDRISTPAVAIFTSVTAVLIFGEIIPQAIVLRFGLAVGANLAWLCRSLMFILWIVAYPISKLLDHILGHHQKVFKRTELREFVELHGEAYGGDLTVDETTVMKGVLDLKSKQICDCMTPIDQVYMIEADRILDEHAMMELKQVGHSRIPIFTDKRNNVKGMLLVKSLLFAKFDSPKRFGDLELHQIPMVNSTAGAYDVLHIFQTGKSHMAGVISSDNREIIGIVTFEDIIEELMQQDIYDEADVEETQMEPSRESIIASQKFKRYATPILNVFRTRAEGVQRDEYELSEILHKS